MKTSSLRSKVPQGGLLVDPDNGFIKGAPFIAGNYAMKIKAVNSVGKVSLLTEIALDVRPGPNDLVFSIYRVKVSVVL